MTLTSALTAPSCITITAEATRRLMAGILAHLMAGVPIRLTAGTAMVLGLIIGLVDARTTQEKGGAYLGLGLGWREFVARRGRIEAEKVRRA